jgi:predicted acylesterase/phospholipase RssA
VGSRRVFILGGGAALGAHQVGVMRMLEESGIRPDAIVGSSIGVVNACLYASGGVDAMEEAWRHFPGGTSIFRPSLRHNPVSGLSLFSMDKLTDFIEGRVDFEKVLKSSLDLSFIVLNMSRGEGQFFSNRHLESAEELRQLTRAGYALPILYPPVSFRDELYVDGGFAWNVPLLQAIEMGATEIYVLAVVSTALPFRRSYTKFTEYLVRLSDVLWRTLGNVGYVTTRIEEDGTYRGVPVTVIHPGEELAGFKVSKVFATTPENTRRLITAGYRDAKRELARRDRKERSERAAVSTLREVEPAFRHEVG